MTPRARPVGVRRRADQCDRLRLAQDRRGRTPWVDGTLNAVDSSRPLRRRLHARAARARARTGGLPPGSASGTGSSSTRTRYERARLAASRRSSGIPTCARRGAVGRVHGADHPRHGRRGRRGGACAEDIVARWERHERFTLYEDVLPVLEALRAHGMKLGLVSNGEPRPGGLRRPPRARGRLRDRHACLRPHEAAPDDLPARPRTARRRRRRRGDGRRLLRGRHRGSACARHARVPARPRGASPGRARPAPDLSRSRRRSGFSR